eukprot:CAMPEP_0177305870 /NCGR_PEP_ID=MMETSP0368-20130122/7402_1 /TAXON_ID=447022 ORGANISM="Scrippsiella hangoei-like, Strain SHHI-4" /NCGR_SAMPLE_ID=MMETSP0368 /ASSEMBLY_ACC=CAM_ASM_000363 /LENGTH=110 /DNA_ID=CAMNT_0018764523 /DNA_START=280 /DNA_END=608 /DNA_ORIENTATION=-
MSLAQASESLSAPSLRSFSACWKPVTNTPLTALMLHLDFTPNVSAWLALPTLLTTTLAGARGAEAAAAAQAESDSNLLRLEVDLLNHAFLVDELHDHHAGDGRHGRVHRR